MRLEISFLKQLPPKPGPEFKNSLPILESIPIALETFSILASVTSHNAETEFIELFSEPKKHFAINFDNSALHKSVVKILDSSIQFK